MKAEVSSADVSRLDLFLVSERLESACQHHPYKTDQHDTSLSLFKRMNLEKRASKHYSVYVIQCERQEYQCLLPSNVFACF